MTDEDEQGRGERETKSEQNASKNPKPDACRGTWREGEIEEERETAAAGAERQPDVSAAKGDTGTGKDVEKGMEIEPRAEGETDTHIDNRNSKEMCLENYRKWKTGRRHSQSSCNTLACSAELVGCGASPFIEIEHQDLDLGPITVRSKVVTQVRSPTREFDLDELVFTCASLSPQGCILPVSVSILWFGFLYFCFCGYLCSCSSKTPCL